MQDHKSQFKIINFKITPYSDNVARYINSISPEKIYKLFNNNTTSDVLTAALYAIYKLELNAFDKNIQLLNKSQYVADAISLDKNLLDKNINELNIYPNVFVLTIDDIYSGHVYSWLITLGLNTVANIIGIRLSISQILKDLYDYNRKYIAIIFINAITEWVVLTSSTKNNYLRVIQPQNIFSEIIKNYGFTRGKSLINNDDTKWLFDNISLGDTSLVQGFIFREYDYLSNLDNTL